MCGNDTFPVIACSVRIRSNREIAPSVFELAIDRGNLVTAPLAGQFFMLRARPSGVLLGRPVSVYLSSETAVTFMILKKGKGTAELCALRSGDSLDIVGPIGNSFLPPEVLVEKKALGISSPRIAIIGGGIGVAPVAGFALGLPQKSYDFFASFRSSPYGIEAIRTHANKLTVTTEDGSAGKKGMLPAVFDPVSYDLVYACGPTPMLRYLQEIGATTNGRTVGPLVFISLEQHMACGAGACLGCTVRTKSGNRRCCVDGPVFNAAEVFL